MIRVTIYKNLGREIGFSINGHAGYGAYGKDVVCAAVSALALNTINSIEELTPAKFRLQSDEQRGVLKFRLTGNTNSESQVLLKSLVLGLENMKRDYGTKYINISYREV